MRIAYFDEKFPYTSLPNEQEVYPYGGGTVFAYNLAADMAEKGNGVYFYTTSVNHQSSCEKEHAITVYRYGTWLKIFRRNISLGLLLKPDADVDIVHAHIGGDPISLMAAMRYAKVKTVPLIVTYHGDAVPSRKDPVYLAAVRFQNLVVRKTLNHAETIIVPSKSLIDRSIVLPEYKSKIKVIPIGIDLDNFNTPYSKYECREKLGLSPRGNVILFMGGLHPKKGPEILIRAMPKVLKNFPATQLILGGSGYLEGKLKHLTLSLGLDRNARFAGFISGDQLKCCYFKAADIFVLPSTTTSECYPKVALEAMAAGTPTIASDIGGVPDAVQEGETGLLVPPGDVTALSEAIIKLLSDKDLREKISDSCKTRVKSYSWDKIADETQELYEQVIAHQKSKLLVSEGRKGDVKR